MGEERRKQASLKTPLGFLFCKSLNVVKGSNKRVKRIYIQHPSKGQVSLKPIRRISQLFSKDLETVVSRGYLGAALKRISGNLKIKHLR